MKSQPVRDQEGDCTGMGERPPGTTLACIENTYANIQSLTPSSTLRKAPVTVTTNRDRLSEVKPDPQREKQRNDQPLEDSFEDDSNTARRNGYG